MGEFSGTQVQLPPSVSCEISASNPLSSGMIDPVPIFLHGQSVLRHFIFISWALDWYLVWETLDTPSTSYGSDIHGDIYSPNAIGGVGVVPKHDRTYGIKLPNPAHYPNQRSLQ